MKQQQSKKKEEKVAKSPTAQKKEEEPNASDDNNQKGLLGMVGSGIGSVATFLFTSPPQSKNKGRSQESLSDPEKKKDNDDVSTKSGKSGTSEGGSASGAKKK